MATQREEPLRGVKYGRYLGPTGRTRYLYEVQAANRYRERTGSRYAYGRIGVKEAKKSIHNDRPNRGHWIRFGVYNKTKGRLVK